MKKSGQSQPTGYTTSKWVTSTRMISGLILLSSLLTNSRLPLTSDALRLSFDTASRSTWFSYALDACMDAWTLVNLSKYQEDNQECSQFARVVGTVVYADFCIQQLGHALSNVKNVSQEDLSYLRSVVVTLSSAIDKIDVDKVGADDDEKLRMRTCMKWAVAQLRANLDAVLRTYSAL